MKKIKVAINGFGRIGRVFTRAAFQHPDLEIVAINDLTDSNTLAHLLKYDSVHRAFPAAVNCDNKHIFIDGKAIQVFNAKDPAQLPWEELEIDIVI